MNTTKKSTPECINESKETCAKEGWKVKYVGVSENKPPVTSAAVVGGNLLKTATCGKTAGSPQR